MIVYKRRFLGTKYFIMIKENSYSNEKELSFTKSSRLELL